MSAKSAKNTLNSLGATNIGIGFFLLIIGFVQGNSIFLNLSTIIPTSLQSLFYLITQIVPFILVIIGIVAIVEAEKI